MTDAASLNAKAMTGDMDACRALYALAGGGCIESQRAILDNLLERAGPLNDWWAETLLEAVILSRMVAARGTQEDRHRLVSVLFCLAVEERRVDEPFRANSTAFEALGVLRDLADEGDGVALKWLADVAPHWPDAMAAIDGAAVTLVADGPLVTEILPPPLVTTICPAGWLPLTLRERMAMWWDDRIWSARLFWWRVVDRIKWGI